MNVEFGKGGNITLFESNFVKIPFTLKYGFFVGEENVILSPSNKGYIGKANSLEFYLWYQKKEDYLEINIEIKNCGTQTVTQDIGFHTGIDSYMECYPQWHDKFFPTLLRCEKTHMWGYYMNTKENALAVATKEAVSSYDINYNMLDEEHCGHRIYGTDIIFIKNATLPERHPQNLKELKAGDVYRNTIYYIPVEKKSEIIPTISRVCHIPMIQAEKYTLEKGDVLEYDVFSDCCFKSEIILPDGRILTDNNIVLEDYGIYTLKVYAENKKVSEAMFCCRKDWDFYLYNAAKEAINKPQKATTHVESFYGLFSLFLSMKYFDDEKLNKKAYECFEEIMPLMFDFEKCEPIVIPSRIQNTALLISLLTDMYEANPDQNLKYLELASRFGDWIMQTQDSAGVYRNKNIHYTCVIYIAKAMLELAFAERTCEKLKDKYVKHYESAGQAVDELVLNLDNIDTEGELTLEDGMISCSALQIAMYALTLPVNKREKYKKAAEYMIKIHSCLEQQLIPDCRMNGASLRYWESQYDVMLRCNMLNSPHGWTGWTAYAHYYLYMLTGKKNYLLSLMNTLGSCAQLISSDGKLRWGFCAQPYVKVERALVPDVSKPVKDGYAFVDLKEPAYRGIYKMQEIGEQYIEMISGWYRTGEQRVNGGYEFCPLELGNEILNVDNQGGCCDNDVHEVFKCIEECVLRKAYVYQNEDNSFLAYGVKAELKNGELNLELSENVEMVIYNLKSSYKNNINEDIISGFGIIEMPKNQIIKCN
ncbi:MAG: hypothetical protein U0M60_11655 [Clostridia bacterium]|nr:hypothetical protein [Clostridia bacterium]